MDRRKRIDTAKPTRVAIDELQLHDLKNMDADKVSAMHLLACSAYVTYLQSR